MKYVLVAAIFSIVGFILGLIVSPSHDYYLLKKDIKLKDQDKVVGVVPAGTYLQYIGNAHDKLYLFSVGIRLDKEDALTHTQKLSEPAATWDYFRQAYE
tara:strand:+ start:3260 stop:3556 length:297 start_codon:yes stop_codon:yes gene_type:complete